MERASLIVWVRAQAVHAPEAPLEVGYTVGSVHVNFDGTVTFFCSGTPTTVAQEDIIRIDYAAAGAEFCPFCDQSLAGFSHV